MQKPARDALAQHGRVGGGVSYAAVMYVYVLRSTKPGRYRWGNEVILKLEGVA